MLWNKLLSYPILTIKRVIIIVVTIYTVQLIKNWIDYRIVYITLQIMQHDKESGAIEQGDGEPGNTQHPVNSDT